MKSNMMFSRILIVMLLSIMTMPVSSQPNAESANGSMNLRGSLLDDQASLEGYPLQVDDGDGPIDEDDDGMMVTVEMAMNAKEELCNRWERRADYPAGIGCELLYLELIKVDADESTSTPDGTVAASTESEEDEARMQEESVPIGASDNVIRDLMIKRLSPHKKARKKERSWNEKQYMTSLENQVAKGTLMQETNGNYMLGRKFIYTLSTAKGRKGRSQKSNPDSVSGRKEKEPEKTAPKKHAKNSVPKKLNRSAPKKTSSAEETPQEGDVTRNLF